MAIVVVCGKYFKEIYFCLLKGIDSSSNFIFEKCMKIAKLSQKNLEKIKQGIDKNQDMKYLVRTIDSYYLKYKIFRNPNLHLLSNDVYC
jgi:hypothetical protein